MNRFINDWIISCYNDNKFICGKINDIHYTNKLLNLYGNFSDNDICDITDIINEYNKCNIKYIKIINNIIDKYNETIKKYSRDYGDAWMDYAMRKFKNLELLDKLTVNIFNPQYHVFYNNKELQELVQMMHDDILRKKSIIDKVVNLKKFEIPKY